MAVKPGSKNKVPAKTNLARSRSAAGKTGASRSKARAPARGTGRGGTGDGEPAPRPRDFGLTTLFVNPEVIAKSRAAMEDYVANYEIPVDRYYPLRRRVCRATGLPGFLTGFNAVNGGNTPLDKDETIRASSDTWLFSDPVAVSLFGIRGVAVKERLPFSDVTRLQGADGAALSSIAHVRYQQMHLQRPVLGGSVVTHLNNRGLISVTSSYFPIKGDDLLDENVDIDARRDQLIAIAKEALAAYLDEIGDAHGPEVMDWEADIHLPSCGERLFILPYEGRYYLACQVDISAPKTVDAYRVFVDVQGRAAIGQPESLLMLALEAFVRSSDLPNARTSITTIDPALSGLTLKTEVDKFLNLNFASSVGGNMAQAFDDALVNPTAVQREAANIGFHAWRLFKHLIQCGADLAKLTPPNDKLNVFVGEGGPELITCFNYSARRITFQNDRDTKNGEFVVGSPGSPPVRAPSLDPELVLHELAHGLMYQLNKEPFDSKNESVPFWRSLLEGYATYFARSLAARSDTNISVDNRWASYAYQGWDDRWALSRTSTDFGSDRLIIPNLYPYENVKEELPKYDVGMVLARGLWDLRSQIIAFFANTTIKGADIADRLALNAYFYTHGWVANFETVAEGYLDTLLQSASNAVGANPNNPVDPVVLAALVEKSQQPRRPVLQLAQELNVALVRPLDARRILAKRSADVMTMIKDGAVSALLVGRASGITRADPPKFRPVPWGQLANSPTQELDGITGLAQINQTVYAATNFDVYSRPADGSTPWTSITAGLAQRPATPLCMVVINAQLHVGSGHGLWRFDDRPPAAPRWDQIGDLKGLVLQVAPLTFPFDPASTAETTGAHVATFADLRHRELFSGPANGPKLPSRAELTWRRHASPALPALSTAVSVNGSELYLGTLADGIWSAKATSHDSGTLVTSFGAWAPVAGSPAPVAGAPSSVAILCLSRAGNEMMAGTESGLHQGVFDGQNWTWSPLTVIPPATVAITSLLRDGSDLYVGSSDGRVWRRNANQIWSQMA